MSLFSEPAEPSKTDLWLPLSNNTPETQSVTASSTETRNQASKTVMFDEMDDIDLNKDTGWLAFLNEYIYLLKIYYFFWIVPILFGNLKSFLCQKGTL